MKEEMTQEHIINRISWLERHKIDPYDVVGDHDEFRFTVSQIEEQNKRIDKEVKRLSGLLKVENKD